jgi:RecA-family ATPase
MINLLDERKRTNFFPPPDDIRLFRDTEPPDPDWIIEGLEPGDVGLLSAAGGTGKSMMCLNFATAVASGTDLFGKWVVGTPGDVTYLYAEDGEATMHRRMHALARQLGGIPDSVVDRLHFYCLRGQPPKFATQGIQRGKVDGNAPVLNELVTVLKTQTRPRLLIVDPLVKFHSLDENSNEQMNDFIDLMVWLAGETGVGVILVHHEAKNGEAGSQNAIRGAGAIVNEARWAVTLRKLTVKEAQGLGINEDARWKYVVASTPKINGTGKLPDLILERGTSGVLSLRARHWLTKNGFRTRVGIGSPGKTLHEVATASEVVEDEED